RSILFVDDVDDARGAEETGVEGLAAGRGVERRPIERDHGQVAARLDALDGRVKRAEIRVEIIEAVGHRVCRKSTGSSRTWRAWPRARSPAARRRTSRRPTRCRDSR